MNWLKNLYNIGLKFSNYNQNLKFVRFRYYSDKVEKREVIRRYGYKERIIQDGLLPHKENGRKIPIPAYR